MNKYYLLNIDIDLLKQQRTKLLEVQHFIECHGEELEQDHFDTIEGLNNLLDAIVDQEGTA